MIEHGWAELRFPVRRLLLNLVVFLGSAAIRLRIAAAVLDNFPSP
jgi:hypothetical protein